MTLSEALRTRRSCRTFAPVPLSLTHISSVLSAARVVQSTWLDEESNAALSVRPYASGGGLYAVEIYLIILNCTDLKPCVAHYDPFAHALSILAEHDSIPERLVAALSDFGDYVPSIGALIVPTVIAERSIAKYGVRGYRFSLIEDGALMASLALAATAAGVSTCHGGGYFDDEVNAMLGVDGRSETVIDCMAIGFGEPSSEA
jgi:SagB-type dehydrogenase family enzyme